MKYLIIIMLSVSCNIFGQLTIKLAQDSTRKYKIASYSYSEEFIGHKGYGAPIILTNDGGAAKFGSWADDKGTCALVLKLDKNGKEQWKKVIRLPAVAESEPEPQSIIQDKNGNFYVFILMYSSTGDRGGSERMMCYDKNGKLLWDKMMGKFTRINNPIVSYVRLLDDGRIYLRGHIATKLPPEGKDVEAQFWEGWLNSTGQLTQKSGDVIDWGKDEWQKKFKPE